MFFGKKPDRLTQNTTLVVEGAPPVTIQLRVSKRARRLSLRVSRLDGRVSLTVPYGVSKREAESFANERADWIRTHLAHATPQKLVCEGTVIPFKGRDMPVLRGTGRSVRLSEDGILLPPGDAQRDGVRLEAFLKEQARGALLAASDHFAAKVGRRFGRITIRDTRSRWGSCSSEGNLMYSWRLVMSPPEVLDYVAAHEVAHLVHMDHSSAFWGQVEAICPDYRTPRAWLRTHGAALHGYKFRL